MSERIGIFAGSFDPLHGGHDDLIRRGRRIFDRIVLGVLNNEKKQPLFSIDERLTMLHEVYADDNGIECYAFDGLLVEFAKQHRACAVLRGLRSGSDLDYEFPMTFMNRRMAPQLETVFLLPSPGVSDLSSSLVKEVYRLGAQPDGVVPPAVHRRLIEKFDE